MKEERKLHFSIDPEWLTDLLRTLWLEREYGKAFRIVEAAFPDMTIPDQIYLVTGKKKLSYSNHPDAVSRSEFILEGDDWKPSGALAGMVVPTFADVLEQSQLFQDNKEAIGLLREVSVLAHSAKGIPSRRGGMQFKAKGSPKGWISASNVVELICRVFPQPTSDQWTAFWEKYGEAVEDIKEPDGDYGATMFPSAVDTAKSDVDLALKWGPSTATNVDIFLAHEREIQNRPTPKPDSKLKFRDGWVVSDGKFYPCGYMEHIWLASRLGKEEKQAEAAGWIKISHGLTGELYIHHNPDAPLSQKQINTIFDWCEKHKAKLPDWAGGKN